MRKSAGRRPRWSSGCSCGSKTRASSNPGWRSASRLLLVAQNLSDGPFIGAIDNLYHQLAVFFGRREHVHLAHVHRTLDLPAVGFEAFLVVVGDLIGGVACAPIQ